jgi:hypothetical protein
VPDTAGQSRATPARTPPAAGWIIPGVFIASLLLAISFGPTEPLAARLIVLLTTTLGAGWMPAVYLLGAIGWGTLARPWTRDLPHASALNAGIGLALTLSATHALGALALLNTLTAWGVTAGGLALLVFANRRWKPALPRLTPTNRAVAALASIGIAITLVAAVSPPGALWDSEFGGYDSLSYHLQLPAEWLETGRIAPSEHNVYSFLPGYYEAAILHQAHLANAPALTARGLSGLLTGHAEPLMAAHLLALGMNLLAAWWTGAFASTLATRAGLDARSSTSAAFIAGAIVLLTPWTQVVGSLAYNEPGVIALGAAALLAAASPGLTPSRRGILVALLIGAAAGCKPTAILFLAPAAAVFMAMTTPPRAWPLMFSIGAIVGLATLALWLIRNAAFSGNPVFPQANTLFTHAHWTPDQSARYATGHTFDGTLTQRVATLILPAADPGQPAVVRWRGLTNPQWAITPLLTLIALALLFTRRPARPIALALTISLAAAIIAWYAFTHLQSRFLIPLLPLMAASIGLVGPTISRPSGVGPTFSRPLFRPFTLAIILVLTLSAAWSLTNLAAQRNADPHALLTFGPAVFTGDLPIENLGDTVVWAGVNETAPAPESLLLVGDATPIYLRRPVVYATVWDTHPLAEAMRASPGDPAAWTADLHAAGIRWVLVSFPELDRLAASAWSDPDLTPDAVVAWAATLGQPTRVWPDQGRALFRLRSAP